MMAGLLAASGCQRRQSYVTSAASSGKVPDQVIEGFTLTQTTNGVKEWVMNARQAMLYESDQRVLVEGVRIDFFRPGEKASSTLTSRQGWVNTLTRDMEAQGHVVLVTPDGGRLTTESLHWNNKLGKVTSDSLVEVIKLSGGRRTIMTGRGLQTDAGLERVEIKQQVRVYSEPMGSRPKGGFSPGRSRP
jgi:LPS export ABC transporter protein LptC